jgi:succinate-acetate transporter protein
MSWATREVTTTMAEQTQSILTQTKIKMTDPTALGVFGLAMVTLVASSQKLGWTTGTAYIIPWAIVLGSLAQVWAASVDFRNNNYFGSIVLGVYGLFWMAVGVHWMIALGWLGDPGAAADPRQAGFAYLGYLVFSLFITVAALEASKVFAGILVLIDVLFLTLALSTFGVAAGTMLTVAGVAEFGISLLGFYCAGVVFLNNFFGRTVLPLGAPFGLVKKA